MRRQSNAPCHGAAGGAGNGLRRLGIVVLGLLCSALVMAGTASAAAPTPDGSFNGSGTPAGSFANTKLAVDQATGDVYVIDSANEVVDRFDSAGDYVSQITEAQTTSGRFLFNGEDDVAVDNSGGPRQGYVYVVSEEASWAGDPSVFAFDASGRFLWQTAISGSNTCGAAVDGFGSLWIGDYNSQSVIELDPTTGSPTGRTVSTAAQNVNPCQVDFDSQNNLYVVSWHTSLDKYDADGTHVAQLSDRTTYDVAVDRTTDEVYAVLEPTAGSFEVAVWDAAGDPVSGTPFATGSPGLNGVAVDGAHGRIYVSNTDSDEIDIWLRDGGAPQPYVTTGDATDVTDSTATLNGSVNPAGDSTTCAFEYVDEDQFVIDGFASASSVACDTAPGSGTNDIAVTASATGLDGGTTYFVRLVATNSAGSNPGSATSFGTVAPPRRLTVTVNGSGGGTVSDDRGGIVDCARDGGTCRAEYADGETVTLTATPDANVTFVGWNGGDCTGTGTCVVSMDADISVTATFDFNRPVATTGGATGVSQTAATLAGTVNPNGASTTCEFQYGTTTGYGSTVPCASAPGSGTAPVPVQAALAGLRANTQYHFRLVATNGGGTTNGANQTFRTPVDSPGAITGAASSITQTTAILGATVNPNGSTTNCTIEYGTTTAYGRSAPCAPAPGAGTAPVAVSASLSGLTVDTTYHFRVVATNASGTTNGADATFRTAAHTCETNPSQCPPPPPPPTCATDPWLCPTPGNLSVDVRVVTVRRGKAALKLTCNGDTACTDQLKLTTRARVGRGRRAVTKTVRLGSVSVDLAAGRTAAVNVTLTRTAKQLLTRRNLRVTVTGKDLSATVTIKKTATTRGRARSRGRRRERR